MGILQQPVGVGVASTVMAHAGNVGVAFLQVSLTRLPMVSYHFQASSCRE